MMVCEDRCHWKAARAYLGPVLEEAATRMAAAINSNIKEHFFERQLQFIALLQNLNMKNKEDREMAREQQRTINKAAPSCPVPHRENPNSCMLAFTFV